MTEATIAPLNDAYTTRRLYLRWRAANGPLPAALVAENGEATSTLAAANGDLILKRGLIEAAGLKAVALAIKTGKIAETDVLTPQEAADAAAGEDGA